MEDNGQAEAPTVKGRHRKSSSLSLSALFHGHLHRRHDLAEPSSPESSPKVNHSRWPIRSRHHNNEHHHPPEIRGKCRNLISRMGHHRRHASDLTYDPLSYAHNFESDETGDDNDSLLRNSFTARLKAGEQPKAAEKATPPPKEVKKARRKSFDLNDLMTVAKSLEDEQPIQNQGNNKHLQTTATSLEEPIYIADGSS